MDRAKKKNSKLPIVIGIVIGLAIVAGWLIFLALFVANSYEFEVSEDGKMFFGVCDFRKDAFCIGPEWEDGEMSFAIPDEFMGCSVTALGGYTGRGYPCPFAVQVDREEIEFVCSDSFFDAHHREDDEYETLVFSIHLGKNLRTLAHVDGKMYCGREREGDESDFLYKVAYFFTVDEENETFYAEGGKLYERATGALVDEFFYK